MDRRHFGKLIATTAAVAVVGDLPAARAQVRQLRMTESGGTSGESVEAGYIKPFTAKSGIKVTRDSPNELGKLRALIESGSTATTLFELGASNLQQAKVLAAFIHQGDQRVAPL
jgi:putative spermidine/putrescine transport system substrate-binding protein